jgi:hypothetical protein
MRNVTSGSEIARKSVKTNRDLIEAIGEFKSAADTGSRRLLRATWVLSLLTVVILVLTFVLVFGRAG